jgi:hypothetical protein
MASEEDWGARPPPKPRRECGWQLGALRQRAQKSKSFLLLFFKKEVLPSSRYIAIGIWITPN